MPPTAGSGLALSPRFSQSFGDENSRETSRDTVIERGTVDTRAMTTGCRAPRWGTTGTHVNPHLPPWLPVGEVQGGGQGPAPHGPQQLQAPQGATSAQSRPPCKDALPPPHPPPLLGKASLEGPAGQCSQPRGPPQAAAVWPGYSAGSPDDPSRQTGGSACRQTVGVRDAAWDARHPSGAQKVDAVTLPRAVIPPGPTAWS